jgi:hypothetical protein
MFNLKSFPTTNFSRYASQNEHTIDDLTDTNNRIQTQQQSPIPPLMSLSISLPIMTANTQLNSTIPTSVTKENIEPLPCPQHGLGPIQRPNKLSCQLNIQSSSSTFPHDSTRSPDTPEVLVQINHLVDHQNSITTIPTIINDIATPNASWTPFSPPEWSTKYESSWPLNTQIQNPFAQRQLSKDETNLWSEPLMNTSWLKFTPISPSNRQENETNNSLWNTSETSWWPKTPSDENNNNQSRWEFAR